MNEDLLQFLWKYKCFDFLALESVEGFPIEIIQVGTQNPNEGPDFLNAEIYYDGMHWKGPIELHLRSSDWLAHQHSKHPLYQNIIAHVVYEHDKDIPWMQSQNIPTLALKSRISSHSINQYRNLQFSPAMIPCEESIEGELVNLPLSIWYEKWLIEKWENTASQIEELYQAHKNHWEATLWTRLAYVLGVKINSEVFQELVKSIPFEVWQKVAQDERLLLALAHGKAGLLETPKDDFQEELLKDYQYVLHKFQIDSHQFYPNFFRLRPPAFPTIRLAYWVKLRHTFSNLFQLVIHQENWEELKNDLKEIKTHSYFDRHWVYGKPARFQLKKMSETLIQSIWINAIIPLVFTYKKRRNEDLSFLIEELSELPKEKNKILTEFEKLGFSNQNALESQALLLLHKKYCSKKKCLLCSIGLQIMKK